MGLLHFLPRARSLIFSDRSHVSKNFVYPLVIFSIFTIQICQEEGCWKGGGAGIVQTYRLWGRKAGHFKEKQSGCSCQPPDTTSPIGHLIAVDIYGTSICWLLELYTDGCNGVWGRRERKLTKLCLWHVLNVFLVTKLKSKWPPCASCQVIVTLM